MPSTPPLDRETALRWVERWERQQEEHLPDREERFTALIDAVQETGRPDPLVVDLGCGPGSLSVRLLDRIPAAVVVAVDVDPVMLVLGRAAYGDRPGLRFVDADLRVPGWSTLLHLDGPLDAAVSTTALHWLHEPQLRAAYRELAAIVRPGGLLLNGDHLRRDETHTPVLASLERRLLERQRRRRPVGDHPETWTGWWEAVHADPLFAAVVAERRRRHVESGHHGSRSDLLDAHVAALEAAGFAEIGTLWQRGDDRLLCAVR